MTNEKPKQYARKHEPDARPESRVEAEIKNRTANNQLPCAVAFEIARNLLVPAEVVGKTADLLNVELVKCQLGLFGYGAAKKKVKQLPHLDPKIEEAIMAALQNGRLPCEQAWAIAMRFNLPKLAVGSACETLQVKIKPCQLGAF